MSSAQTDYPELHLLIGDEALSGDGRNSEEVIDPATGNTIGTLPHATSDDLDRALDHAEQGFKDWRKTSADKRAGILVKAGKLLRERIGTIAPNLVREQGKTLNEAKGEVIYTAMLLEFYAGEIKRSYGRTLVRPAGSRVEVQYHPVGPVAGFAPWNFPIINVVRKIGGALAAGCSTIVKPSEETPGQRYRAGAGAARCGRARQCCAMRVRRARRRQQPADRQLHHPQGHLHRFHFGRQASGEAGGGRPEGHHDGAGRTRTGAGIRGCRCRRGAG